MFLRFLQFLVDSPWIQGANTKKKWKNFKLFGFLVSFKFFAKSQILGTGQNPGPKNQVLAKNQKNCRFFLNSPIFPLSPCLGSLGLLTFLTACTSRALLTIAGATARREGSQTPDDPWQAGVGGFEFVTGGAA